MKLAAGLVQLLRWRWTNALCCGRRVRAVARAQVSNSSQMLFHLSFHLVASPKGWLSSASNSNKVTIFVAQAPCSRPASCPSSHTNLYVHLQTHSLPMSLHTPQHTTHRVYTRHQLHSHNHVLCARPTRTGTRALVTSTSDCSSSGLQVSPLSQHTSQMYPEGCSKAISGNSAILKYQPFAFCPGNKIAWSSVCLKNTS